MAILSCPGKRNTNNDGRRVGSREVRHDQRKKALSKDAPMGRRSGITQGDVKTGGMF